MQTLGSLLALALLASAAPAQAFHDTQLPVLLELASSGGSWFRVDVSYQEGAAFYVEQEIEAREATGAYLGVWILRSGETEAAWLDSTRAGRRTRVASVPIGVIIEDPAPKTDADVASGFVVRDALEAGSLTVVMVMVADGTAANGVYRIGGIGVTIESFATGTDAFLRTETDFATGTHVRSPEGAAELVLSATSSVVTQDPTFSWLSASHGIGMASYDGPGGNQQSEIGGHPSILLSGAPPGTHAFTLDTAVGAAETGWVLVGAGVSLE